MKKNILYVEDDPALSFVTCDNLSLQGYTVHHCPTAEEALSCFAKENIELCILDIMLPAMDGFELASHIRKQNKAVPILFLSAKSLTEDRIKGFQMGADDYLVKPFHMEELFYKIEVFLKRRELSSLHQEKSYQIGSYEFHVDQLQLIGKAVKKLTKKEADLLHYFVRRREQIIPREELLENLWGKNDYFLGRSLDVFISRLRKYLSEDKNIKLENRHGIGFVFSFPLASENS